MPGVCRRRPALRILPHGEIRDGSGSFWETRPVGAVVRGATPGGGAECGSGSRRVSPGRGRALPGPVAGYWALLTGNRGPRRPSRGPRRRRLSKSAAKARIAPERAKRIVDIPRFFSRPIAPRSAFATDLDTPPPRLVPGAPCAPPRPHSTRTVGEDNSVKEEFLGNHRRAGGLARRDRVCYAPFPLLRSSALRYASFSRTAEDEGA